MVFFGIFRKQKSRSSTRTHIGYFKVTISLYPSNFSCYAGFVRLSVQQKYSVTILKYYCLSNRMITSKSSSSTVGYLTYKVSVAVSTHLL